MGPSVVLPSYDASESSNVHETLGVLFLGACCQVFRAPFADPPQPIYSSLCERPSAFACLRVLQPSRLFAITSVQTNIYYHQCAEDGRWMKNVVSRVCYSARGDLTDRARRFSSSGEPVQERSRGTG